MNLERYQYRRTDSHLQYEFYSIGPKGRIKKLVQFDLFFRRGIRMYNLGFGDWDETAEAIDDTTITNNGDAEKVLATVAAIVIEFTGFFPETVVYAKGSNIARSRRYQMGINKFWDEIEEMFNVFGEIGEHWEPFRKNINYGAFAIAPKKFLILEEQTESYMPKKMRSKKKNYEDVLTKDEVVPESEMEYWKNDPFFVKKTEEARKHLDRVPFPLELLER